MKKGIYKAITYVLMGMSNLHNLAFFLLGGFVLLGLGFLAFDNIQNFLMMMVFGGGFLAIGWNVVMFVLETIGAVLNIITSALQYGVDYCFKMGRFEEHSYENQNYNDYHKQYKNDNYQEEPIQEPIEEPIEEPINPRLEKLMTMAKRGTTNEQTIAKKKILNMLEKEGYIEK